MSSPRSHRRSRHRRSRRGARCRVVASSRRRHQLRGVDRGRCLRRRSRQGARAQRARRALARRELRSRRCPARADQHRLRLRRLARSALQRVGRAGAAERLRRVEVDRRARGVGARPIGDRGAHVVGLRAERLQHGQDDHATRCSSTASWRSSTTRSATRRSPPISRRWSAASRSTAQRHPSRHQPDRRRVGTASPATVVAAMGKDPDMVRPITTAELQPPRPAPRPPTACSTTRCCAPPASPLLRDFGEPLRETVQALSQR